MENSWFGFREEKFVFEDHNAVIVYPAEGTANGRLVLKTEYWPAFQDALELPLVKCGFHLCYIANDNRFALENDLDRKARFVRFVAEKCGVSERTIPVGMSCGGLIAIKFAARHPNLVSCLYLDAPVLNYMSWPCGFGTATNVPEDNSEIFKALGINFIGDLIAYRDMPLDKLGDLIRMKIPVFMASGDSDTVVPYVENGIFLERAYKAAGLDIEVQIKPGGDHHPHGPLDAEAAIRFINRH